MWAGFDKIYPGLHPWMHPGIWFKSLASCLGINLERVRDYNMEHIHTPASQCPVCKKNLDAASATVNRGPRPGDFSICLYCQAWLRYNDDLSLRLLNEEDIKKIPKGMAEIDHALYEFKASKMKVEVQ